MSNAIEQFGKLVNELSALTQELESLEETISLEKEELEKELRRREEKIKGQEEKRNRIKAQVSFMRRVIEPAKELIDKLQEQSQFIADLGATDEDFEQFKKRIKGTEEGDEAPAQEQENPAGPDQRIDVPG